MGETVQETDAPEGDSRAGWRRRALPFLAGAAMLLASFVSYLRYHDYPMWRGEVAIAVAILLIIPVIMSEAYVRFGAWGRAILLGLLFLMAFDINGDNIVLALGFGLIAAAMGLVRPLDTLRFAAFVSSFVLATSLVGFAHARPTMTRTEQPARSARNDALPLVVHLILDEHAGLVGLERSRGGTRAAQRISNQYHARGFQIYRGAFSRSFHTANAVPTILSLEHGSPETPVAARSLTYFDALNRMGFRTNIIQSSYYNLCARARYVSCTTYWHASLRPIADAAISRSDKATIILYNFAGLSKVAVKLAGFYDRWLSGRLGRFAPVDEVLLDEKHDLNSVNSEAALGEMETALTSARQGEVYFGHFLIPHHPYVFDGDCKLRGADAWRIYFSKRPVAERDRSYEEQLQCVTKHISQILKSVAKSPGGANSVIIIHGDHGSRIVDREPYSDTAGTLTDEEMARSFSTLFAVRMPGHAAAIIDSQAPVSLLLKELADSRFTQLPSGRTKADERWVHLENRNWVPIARVRLPNWQRPVSQGSQPVAQSSENQ